MSSKKGQLPELLFVSPIGHGKHKIRHKHVVFRVLEWDETGRPRKFAIVHDDEVMNIKGGEEFITGYVQSHVLQPEAEKANKRVD